MSREQIPGYRHHFVSEFDDNFNNQNAKKTRGRLKIDIEVSLNLKVFGKLFSKKYNFSLSEINTNDA